MTRVLIVEDDEENRNLLGMLLLANGYRVTVAGDGLEALDAARRHLPDAIVSDVLMPKLDGFGLCRAWMQDARLRGIPFIFYSATNVRPEDEEFGLTLGAVRYLIKPLQAEVFLAELHAVLQRWGGCGAPAAAPPLDDVIFHTLHELALSRKIEDKLAQLKAANCKLQESEARFRSLTEMSSDFYWESDAGHRLMLRNSAVSKSSTESALVRATQISEHQWDTPDLPPDEAGWGAHRALLDAHQPFRQIEFSRLWPDGTERHFSISGDPIFDALGAFKGYRGVGADITERVKRIHDLQRLHAAMDATADAVYLVDRTSMRFVYVNDAACRMQCCTREELLALGPDGALSTPRAELEQVYDAIIAGGAGTDPVEMRRQRKDGSVVWTELRRRAQRSSEGWMMVTVVRDITERKQAESALRESEDRYRDLVENSGVVICTHDLQGKLLSVNAAMVRFTGYSREALLSMNVAELLTRGARDGIAGYLDEIRTKGRARGLMEIRTAEGKSRWWEYHNTLRAEDVATPVVRGMGEDVTDRKRAQDALRKSEVQLKGILESTVDGILAVDGRGKVIQANRRFAELWCIPRPLLDSSDGETLLDLVACQLNEADAFATKVHASCASDAESTDSLTFKDGRIYECHSSPLILDGTVVGRVWSLRDTTERKQSERQLVESEGRFRGLVEQAIAGIYIIQDDKLVYVNPRFAEIFGYGCAAELNGCSPSSIVAGKDRRINAERIRQQGEGEVAIASYQFTGVRKDGSAIEIGAHGARATHGGRPAVIGMMQDISEKKRAEEQIQGYFMLLENAFMSTVQVAMTLGELRDPYTAGHQRRVAEIAVAVGAELGFDTRRQEGLRVAGYLHDIGKIRIPSEILSKPGELSPVEIQLVQGHARSSYDVLKEVKFPWPVAEVALQHHERMDGSGYPQGLKGEAILLEARIMAVADVVEAMSSHRPYRAGLGIEAALSEIERGRASAYDPVVADACLKLFRKNNYAIPA